MSDRLLTLAWRKTELSLVRDRDPDGGATVTLVRDGAVDDVYVWRHGRADVTLRRVGDQWSVVCTTIPRLIGPRHELYSARHRRADHASWDVMARVIRLTRDEAQGLQAGCDAARWIRNQGFDD